MQGESIELHQNLNHYNFETAQKSILIFCIKLVYLIGYKPTKVFMIYFVIFLSMMELKHDKAIALYLKLQMAIRALQTLSMIKFFEL